MTDQKRQAKIDLISQAHEIASLTHATANEAGLTELASRCNYSFTKIFKSRETAVVQRCRDIHGAASENLPLLADSNVDAKALKDFKGNIDAFEMLKPAPRNQKVKRRVATKSVKSLVREAGSILAQRIDKLMVPSKKTDPDFYNAYKAARVIVARVSPAAKRRWKWIRGGRQPRRPQAARRRRPPSPTPAQRRRERTERRTPSRRGSRVMQSRYDWQRAVF